MTADVAVPGAEPEAFLRLAEGRPRGLWSRGERWVAHSGVLATLTVSGADGTQAAGRFRDIARQAAALPRPADTCERVRVYGGFAFGHDHEPSGPWRDFPSALFHLPEIELAGDAGGRRRLRVRATAHAADHERVRDTLGRQADELAAALREAGRQVESEAGGHAPGPGRLSAQRRDAWQAAVQEILDAIASGEVSKVVLARTLDVATAAGVTSVAVVRALRAENPGTHVFLFEPEPGRALLGAAPEAVATLRRRDFHATAVAGSVARGCTDAEQRALAESLLTSAKDRAEQRAVVDDMVARLAPLARDIRADAEPRVLTLARIQHLETRISAHAEPGRSVLDLLEALHPTPAVCGVPREGALKLLRREEPFERGWYAGPVGWFTLDGDGHFVPALRTAVGGAEGWRLFAGAGIVEGSRPAAEWDETAIKFQPVLRALATAGVGIPDFNGDGGGPPRSDAPPQDLPAQDP